MADVDIDPNSYPGQPETQEVAPGMPTVLNKLQKWGEYASSGEPVHPSRFIPMKTPLSSDIIRSWTLAEPPRHTLTVSGMVEHQASCGRRVGLIIDLSNHECLYTQDLLQHASLAYEHIKLVAKELPPLDYVNQVAAVAKAFWAEHPDEHIAIHCAYGFNRTGFIVTSFLIQEYGMSVGQALEAFATARPPGVKHEKFKMELARRYPERSSALQGTQASADAASDNSSLSPTVARADSQLDDPEAFRSSRPTACCSCDCASHIEATAAEPLPDAAACSGNGNAAADAGAAAGATADLDGGSAQALGASGQSATLAAMSGAAGPQVAEATAAGSSAIACNSTARSSSSSRCSSSSTSIPIKSTASRPVAACSAAAATCSNGAGPAGASMAGAASPPADNESLGFSERAALASLSRLAGASQEQGSSGHSAGRSSPRPGRHRSVKDLQWEAPAAHAAAGAGH